MTLNYRGKTIVGLSHGGKRIVKRYRGDQLVWSAYVPEGKLVYPTEHFFIDSKEYLINGNFGQNDNHLTLSDLKLNCNFSDLNHGVIVRYSGLAISDYSRFYNPVPFANPPEKTGAGTNNLWGYSHTEAKFEVHPETKITKEQLMNGTDITIFKVTTANNTNTSVKVRGSGSETISFTGHYPSGSDKPKSTSVFYSTGGAAFLLIDSITAY